MAAAGPSPPPVPSRPHTLPAATKRVIGWIVGAVGYLAALTTLIATWPFWWYAVPATVMVAGLAAGIALIPFAHEKVKQATAAASSASAIGPIAVAMVYDAEAAKFNIYNTGPSNFGIWGSRFNNGFKLIDSTPLIVAPGPIGDFIPLPEDTQQILLDAARETPDSRIPLDLYAKTDSGEEVVLHFVLLPAVERGHLKITVRQEGAEKTRWSADARTLNESTQRSEIEFTVRRPPPRNAIERTQQQIADSLGLMGPRFPRELRQRMGMDFSRHEGETGFGFGRGLSPDATPRQAAPGKPTERKPSKDQAQITTLARRIRAFVTSHERRSPPVPPPRPVYDPDDQDFDDRARIASSLLQSMAEDDYRRHWAGLGFWFYERFAKQIAAVRSVVEPTIGDDPALACFRGTFDVSNCTSETLLRIAEHLEKVARGMNDKADG